MAQRREVLRASASQAVSTLNGEPNHFGQDRFVGAIITVEYVSGTGTLDVWVQYELPDGAFNDFARITQLVAAGKRVIAVIAQGNVEAVAQDGAIAAATIRNGPIGSKWRLKSTVATAAVTWKADVDLYA